MSAQVPTRTQETRQVPTQLSLFLPEPPAVALLPAKLEAAVLPTTKQVVEVAPTQQTAPAPPPAPAAPTAKAARGRPKKVAAVQPNRSALAAISVAAIEKAPATLAEAVERLDALTSLPKGRRQHLQSALRTAGRVIGQPLRDITTDLLQLRVLLASSNPATAGVTADRWLRVRSLLLAALREVGIEVMPGRDKRGLCVQWGALFDRLPTKRHRIGLSRLVHFCSREGIMPADVDGSTLARFRDAMAATSLRSDSFAAFNTACRLWNEAGESVSGWPSIRAEVQRDSRKYTLPQDRFVPAFLNDVERFLAHSGDRNPFAEDYARSVKPSTIELRRKGIMQLATALVCSGLPADEVTGIAVLVEPKNAEAALRYLLNRKNNESTPYLAQQSRLLVVLASYWVKADDATIKALKGFTKGLAVQRKGMTDRNRARLRQFDLPANVNELLDLPRRVLEDVKKHDSGNRDSALRVMFAAAVEILIVAPIRIANLCGLDIARHLLEIGRGRHRKHHIIIPGGETKTGVPIEKELTPKTWSIVSTYLAQYRERICSAPGTMLFPGVAGKSRAVTRFSTDLSKFVFNECGIKMHAHLFRHFAGKLRTEEDPSDIETVRQLLGHKSAATATRNYLETRTDQALKRYEETLARRREQAGPVFASRRGRAQRGAPT